jgi:hypothetical protein
MKLIQLSLVTRGPDPRVLLRERMDCRVKPGNDVVGGSVSAEHALISIAPHPDGADRNIVTRAVCFRLDQILHVSGGLEAAGRT